MQGLVPARPAVPDNADLRSPLVSCHRETGCLFAQCIAELADRLVGELQFILGAIVEIRCGVDFGGFIGKTASLLPMVFWWTVPYGPRLAAWHV